MNDLEFKIQLHNKLSEITELFLYQYSPCQMEGSNCAVGANECCLGSRFRCKVTKACVFLGKEGCKTKNITCLVWLCDDAKKANPICSESLQLIDRLAKANGLTD